jgi:2,3,4,5-tetrahydropyridine-2-carboxylate N-succinyltransferase
MTWLTTLDQLERGEVRAAYQNEQGQWVANVEVKKAILAAFKAGSNTEFEGAYQGFVDKINLPPRQFTAADQVRLVPGGSSVRRGAYVAPGVIIMPPAYINIGAFVDTGSMIDSHALVGSCAQIGKNVHVSAGVQIGGVLEPIGANPVIVEDDAFIGAGAILVEGVVIGKGAVIAPGVSLSAAVAVYDCVNQKVLAKGAPIPAGAVVIPGARPMTSQWGSSLGLSVSCGMIVKYRDEKSNASLELEEVLR